MPTTIYDSSLITQRRRDKAISGSFINRIQNPIDPTTGSAPLLGISEQSIINTVKNGQMSQYKKDEGGCTSVSIGCPCNIPSFTPLPSLRSIQLTAQWATYFNINTTTFQGISISNDSLNNIYMTGVYNSGSATIIQNALGNGQSSSSIIMPQIPNAVPFLIKYNSDGQVQWATYLNGTGFNYSTKVICDSLNNIYISGAYESGTQLAIYNALGNGQTLSSITLPAAPTGAAFLVKYTSAGQAQWATYLDSSGNNVVNSISIDSSDNIYITGEYLANSLVSVQNVLGNGQTPSLITLPISSVQKSFLIKYNSLGQAQWATYFDASIFSIGESVVVDSSDNIYISGSYKSISPIFVQNVSGNGQNPSSITLPILSSNATFLIKYDSNGQAQKATYFNSSGNTGGLLDDAGSSISIDSANNIYLSGVFVPNSLIPIQNADGTSQTPSYVTISANNVIAYAFLIKYN